MALQNRTQLTTTINTNIPVGTSAGVTATNHRQVEENLADGIWSKLNTSITNTDSPYAVDLNATQNLFADATSGAITVTLPSSPTNGDRLRVMATGTTNAVTIDGNGNNVNGSATLALAITQYTWVDLEFTTEWFAFLP